MKKFDWKELDIVKVCMYYGLAEDIDDEWVLCPVHENDDREHKPSCKVYHNDDKDVIVCFGGCTNNKGNRLCLDNISLIAELEGLDQQTDFLEIIDILKEIDSWEKVKTNKIRKRENIKKIETKDMYELLYSCSKTIHDLHLENKYFVDNYLNQRGIIYDKCKDALEKSNLEFRHNYYKNENSLILFDTNHKFAIKRKIDDYLYGKSYNKDDCKYQNINSPYYSKIGNNRNNIILFESFYDLLALYSHIKNPELFTFISSNSTSNKHLIYIKERELLENANNVFLLFDNDTSGDKAAEFFKEKLNNVKDIRNKLNGCKDVCDYIKSNLYIRIKNEDIINN